MYKVDFGEQVGNSKKALHTSTCLCFLCIHTCTHRVLRKSSLQQKQQVQLISQRARNREVERSETVIHTWNIGRHFYRNCSTYCLLCKEVGFWTPASVVGLYLSISLAWRRSKTRWTSWDGPWLCAQGPLQSLCAQTTQNEDHGSNLNSSVFFIEKYLFVVVFKDSKMLDHI